MVPGYLNRASGRYSGLVFNWIIECTGGFVQREPIVNGQPYKEGVINSKNNKAIAGENRYAKA